MSGKNLIPALIFVWLITSPALSLSSESYLAPGRAALFDGTLSGLQNAGEIFDSAISDPECDASREIKFFHALSRIAMWAVRDDGGSVNSALELAREYGATITGDYLRELTGTVPEVPVNRYDSYDIPSDAETRVWEFLTFLDQSARPEIDEVIEELTQISDEPGDPFRVYLTPQETAVFLDPMTPLLTYDLEVDTGDVLILKGLLYGLKASLEAKSAYDMSIDPEDRLIEKIHGDSFSVNADLLGPHPELFTLLPSSHDPNDGKAILADARGQWLFALYYIRDAINYIESEDTPPGTDPQEDELLWIDPADGGMVDLIKQHIQILTGSLENDTSVTIPYESEKTYLLSTPDEQIGRLTLKYDALGEPTGKGTLILDAFSQPWQVTDLWFYETSQFNAQVTCIGMAPAWHYYYGDLWGTISPDKDRFYDATLEYWGNSSDRIDSITATLSQQQESRLTVDLNPIFGSSPRYPDPVSPRDLLPEFDRWRFPLPNTAAKGLGSDSTLGGILPETTHEDWNRLGNLQPAGIKHWEEIEYWQKLENWVYFWTEEQCVFTDPLQDVEGEQIDSTATDIHQLFMGMDTDYLHGCLVLAGPPEDNVDQYTITLTPSPFFDSILDSMKLEFCFNNGDLSWATLYHAAREYGWVSFRQEASIDTLLENNLIHFRIPLERLPVFPWGRYLEVNAVANWGQAQDANHTRTRIDLLDSPSTISGTIEYPGYLDAPIYIQTFSDPYEPERSLIASTMITEPGPFTIEGLGLGQQGYIRAFTPLFGFNLLDLEAMNTETVISVRQYQNHVSGVSLTLPTPPQIEFNTWIADSIDPARIDLKNYYAFDAIEGATYVLSINQHTTGPLEMKLLGRNGHDILNRYVSSPYYWDCPVSGRYYIEISSYSLLEETIDYEIQVVDFLACPSADISGYQWFGVKDCMVDMYDLSLLASYWLSGCSDPYWCQQADYNKDYQVDTQDLIFMMNQWMDTGTWTE